MLFISLKFIGKWYVWYFHCLFINNFTICMHMMCWIHEFSDKRLVCIVLVLMHVVVLLLLPIFYIMPRVPRLLFLMAKLIKCDSFTFHISTFCSFFCFFLYYISTESIILVWFYNTRLHQELNDMYIYLYVIYYLGQTIGQL